jgi:ActR/RegA family two-component response regulator
MRATSRGKGKAVSVGAQPSSTSSPHTARCHLVVLSDDLHTLKALRWALLDERVTLSELYVERTSAPSLAEQLRAHLSERPDEHTQGETTLCVVSLRERPAQLISELTQRHQGLRGVVCARDASVSEARESFKAGALDYLPLSVALSGGLCDLLLKLIQANAPPVKSVEAPTPPSVEGGAQLNDHPPKTPHHELSHERPLTTEERDALLERLVREELSFQEAITPLEDELRRRYLRRLLEREPSIAAAARHAGVERANFKRLLKRYDV